MIKKNIFTATTKLLTPSYINSCYNLFSCLLITIIVIYCLLFNSPHTSLIQYAYADNVRSSSDINNHLKQLQALRMQINTINTQLKQDSVQADDINNSITKVNNAILQSQQLLSSLSKNHSYNLLQLQKVNQELSQLEISIANNKQTLEAVVIFLYNHLNSNNTNTDNFLLNSQANNTMANIKEQYLIKIINHKLQLLRQLSNRLKILSDYSTKLSQQIKYLENNLNLQAQQTKQLSNQKIVKIEQSQKLLQTIKLKTNQLTQLKQSEDKLNKLIDNLNSRVINKNTINSDNTSSITTTKNQDINQSKLQAKFLIIKPVQLAVLVPFAATTKSGISRGILFNTVLDGSNKAHKVFAVQSGVVVYIGRVYGFGNIIIIKHENNYMSIYSGVNALVKIGSRVILNQEIANININETKELGGFYFELRHLGTPVNPSKFFR